MATPFQERSPRHTASYPRARRESTGNVSCAAFSSWRQTTSGATWSSQANGFSRRLLMLLILKVAIFTVRALQRILALSACVTAETTLTPIVIDRQAPVPHGKTF